MATRSWILLLKFPGFKLPFMMATVRQHNLVFRLLLLHLVWYLRLVPLLRLLLLGVPLTQEVYPMVRLLATHQIQLKFGPCYNAKPLETT
jgi:hypothetical protein